MKHHLVFWGALGFASLVLAGCPIYSDVRCIDDLDCPGSQVCSPSGYCMVPSRAHGDGTASSPTLGQLCSMPEQCLANEVCAADGTCHPGDCFFSGCVTGYSCVLHQSRYVCVESGSEGSGTGGSSGGAGTSGAGGTAGTAGASGAG